MMTPLRLCPVTEMIGDAATPGLAHRVLGAELNFTSVDEPSSFSEAEQEVPW
jgi:hypothetical protein